MLEVVDAVVVLSWKRYRTPENNTTRHGREGLNEVWKCVEFGSVREVEKVRVVESEINYILT